MSSPPFPEENALVAALRSLPASGSGSFENLVRDLLSRATGRRFTLAKSGPQGGVDSRTDDDGFAIVIGVEAKRYGATTPLPLDETLSKLRDAARAHPDLELWILLATREVKESDRSQLRAEGDTLGVEVLILDWPDSAELLPDLMLLATAQLDILGFYIEVSAEISATLDGARNHLSYTLQNQALETRLLQPALGYANARNASSDSVRLNMGSMAAASARIGRYTNLTDPAVIRIDRPELRQAITTWWDGLNPRPTLLLLGTEGLGKTWAALSWWLDRELAGSPLPLTLIVPARSIIDATPDTVIGTALHRLFETRDPAWWARRARRWCANAADTRLLVIIDGLNERFEAVDWASLASELTLDPWQPAVSIICTDRWDHWRRVAGSFQAAEIGHVEQAVTGFSDAELDEVLGRAGLKRDQLDPKLIPLMKVPRLCALAIRHWEKLGRSGDITPERLVYEDFRERIYPGHDDDEIRNLIAGIGQEILASGSLDATVLRRQIGDTLAQESGGAAADATISAIVSGVWFASVPGEPHQFRMNPELAPIAMGLALARAVQSLATAQAVEQRIEAFVDDLRGLELGITVVGIAASFATIWPESSAVARTVLLDRWLSSDNFSGGELKRYTRLIAENCDLFLSRTEAVWRDRDTLHNDRNIHLAGMVNAAEAYPLVMTAFVERATAWLSEAFGWRDAMNDGTPPTEVAASAVEARVLAWNEVRGELPPIRFMQSTEDWVSVAGTTLGAISYLPRAPFAVALGNYAIAARLMREVYPHDRFHWLLRANDEDVAEAEIALTDQAKRIGAVMNEEAEAASDILLNAVSSLDPRLWPKTNSPERRFGRDDSVGRSENGTLVWTYELENEEAGWSEVALRYASDLAPYAPDPNERLAEDGVNQLRAAFTDVLENDGDRGFHLWDEVRVVLARWAPDLLASYLSRTDAIDTGRRNWPSIVDGWKASWVAQDGSSTHAINSAFEASVRGAREAGTSLNPDLVTLALAERSATEQFDAFLAMPSGPTWPKNHVDLLKPPGAAEYARLEMVLVDDADPALLRSWLGLLVHVDLKDMPIGWPPIVRLMAHGDTDVRTVAMHVAWHANDKVLCNVLRDSGWTAEHADGQEALHGSVALCCAEPVAGDERPKQIIPLASGFLARTWPEEERYQVAFAEYVEGRVNTELNPPRSSQGFGYSFNDRDTYLDLVRADPERIEAWLAPAIAGTPINIGHLLFSADKATIELTRALLEIGRPSAAPLWRALVKSMGESNIKSDGLRLMPFQAPLTGMIEELRLEALSSANLDEHLFEVASVLRRRGEGAWMIAAIGRMLGSNVYDTARGLVLAGELDSDADAETLWSDDILPRPLPRWLSKVRATARQRYLANVYARHWLKAFIDAQDALVSFGTFELFRLTMNRTTTSWATRMIDEASDQLSARAHDHWRLNVPDLNARIKELDKGAKDNLAYTRVPRHEQAPWR